LPLKYATAPVVSMVNDLLSSSPLNVNIVNALLSVVIAVIVLP
jgi:hypothetical protein